MNSVKSIGFIGFSMQDSEAISHMDALLFGMNLEVMLLQLCVLEGCAKYNSLHHAAQTKNESLQRDKLAKERYIVKDVIKRSLIELIENGGWSTLMDSVSVLERNASYITSLREHHEELKDSLKIVNMKLIKCRQDKLIYLRDSDLNIAMMKDKIQDTILNTNMRLSYVEKWLSARAEALDLQHRVEMKPAPSQDIEKRVHDQVVEAYKLQTKEREDSLFYWQARYAKDTADLTARLNNQCERLREAVCRRTELQKLFDLHEGEMRAWLTFKRERAARLAREERSRVAATRIQAWWRGVMVRRCLGVFRQLKNTKKTPSKLKRK